MSNTNKRTPDQIFAELERIANVLPTPIYWLNTNDVVLGANDLSFKTFGGDNDRNKVIGKGHHDFYPPDIAKNLIENNKKVVKFGVTIEFEEKIANVTTGTIQYFTSIRSPLRDDEGNIIGIIGTSIEITAQKEAERLKYENERLEFEQKTHLIEKGQQEQFKKIVKQVIHDITSPVTSIDNIVSKLNSNVPEDDRVTLRNAAMRISGISQKLLSQYNDEDLESGEEYLLASLALLQIVNEKREEYRASNVQIEVDIDEDVNFTFIKHNAGMFKRMVSNLVNNSVDALKNRPNGRVTIRLGINADKAVIIIQDNGSGMPQHIIDKFNQGISVTEGKEKGHGVGLTQVYDAITLGNGTYKIHASENGTKTTIRFPIVATPGWLATEIKLTKDDTIIILDDDNSIHGSWDKNFASILEQNPTLTIKHFYQGKEVVNYINNLTLEQKQDIFLLTDFELLEQGINGLEVVAQTNMHRAILVTSYSANSDRQMEVTKLGIKMLPKELASKAKIRVDKRIPKWSSSVDMVWVEDQVWYIDDLVNRYYNHIKVDKYYDPASFMENVHQYPLNTRIILDTYYETPNGVLYDTTGYDLARELHALGYTKLVLFTGEHPQGRAPDYLTVARKKDMYAMENLDKL